MARRYSSACRSSAAFCALLALASACACMRLVSAARPASAIPPIVAPASAPNNAPRPECHGLDTGGADYRAADGAHRNAGARRRSARHHADALLRRSVRQTRIEPSALHCPGVALISISILLLGRDRTALRGVEVDVGVRRRRCGHGDLPRQLSCTSSEREQRHGSQCVAKRVCDESLVCHLDLLDAAAL